MPVLRGFDTVLFLIGVVRSHRGFKGLYEDILQGPNAF